MRPYTPPPDTAVPVLLVTGYLGEPVTAETILQDGGKRFDATCQALRTLRNQATGVRILLAFTGDAEALRRLVSECDWPIADAAWFEQNAEAIPFGKGFLEHQLIGRALKYWKLIEQECTVLKLTAKYTVENLQNVLRLAGSSRLPLYGWQHPGQPLIDSRCFFFRANAYQGFSAHLERIDDRRGYYMEHALYDSMRQLRIKAGWLRHRPLVCGLSGSTGVTVRTVLWKRCLVYCASLSLPIIKRTQTSHFARNSGEVQIVLPALKVSGGVAEALRLASDIETTGAKVGAVIMWRSPQALLPSPALSVHALSDWSTRSQLAPFQLPVLAARFRRWLQARGAQNCDWIFTHYSTLPLALLVPRHRRWFFVQGLEWQFVGNKLLARLLRHVILWSYRRSQLMAANPFLAKALQAEGLVVRSVIPIWADPCFDQTVAGARDIDVLMVLRKGGCKRLDLYLQAIDWFISNAPELRVAVITTEDEIGVLVRDKVAECYVCPGGHEAMLKIYRRSRLLLLLSEHEGFALPPLEAMGSGCVPLCRDSGGPQAYMNAPLDSLLQPLSQPLSTLCSLAVEVLSDEERWQRLSNAARDAFKQGLCLANQRGHLLAPLFPWRNDHKRQ